MTKKLGFYFAPKRNRLKYGDGRLVRVGTTHSVDVKPKCCEVGLHASHTPFKALKYTETSILYLVDVWGDVDEQDDKFCGTHRKYLARFDTERLLREFARKQAMINIEKIKPYCSEKDYEVIIKWLETGKKKYQKAAWSAAESAAWSATEYAAWYAARSAAESATRSAAWYAARSAAESATRSAAIKESDQMLLDMVIEATGWDIAKEKGDE